MTAKASREMGQSPDELERNWRDRERYWQRKLGRLRLGAEPLGEQLERYRRVTWALTLVPSAIALMFITLFTVFGRPDVGLILVAILLAPVVLFAWLDYARLAYNARRYEAERTNFLNL